jgi:hypothetical protein
MLTAMAVGACVGAAVGAFGDWSGVSPTTRREIATVGLVALSIRELGWVRFPMPGLKLIIPPKLVAGGPSKAAIIWGAALGAGFVTLIRFGVFWGMQLATFVIGSPSTGAITGLMYGFSRSVPTLVIWYRPRLRCNWLMPTPKPVFAQGQRMARLGAAAMMAAAVAFATMTLGNR